MVLRLGMVTTCLPKANFGQKGAIFGKKRCDFGQKNGAKLGIGRTNAISSHADENLRSSDFDSELYASCHFFDHVGLIGF